MIKALVTLVKIAIVVAFVVWVAENPGTISIDWLSYTFTFHVGFFLFAQLIMIALGIALFSFIKGLLDLPKNLTRYRDMTYKDKGIKALALGMTAVAAGDAKSAKYQAHRAKKFMRDDNPLSKLLEAQAARLNGNELDAARAFTALMDDRDSAFLGVRGLLQSALDHGDYKGALELGHRALVDYPKQDWILRIVYDLEIRARNWDNARKLIYRLEKAKAISPEQATRDRVAMLIAESEIVKEIGQEELYYKCLTKAYKTDPTSVPAILRLADLYIERGKKKAAISLVKKAWIANPHPGLTNIWERARIVPKAVSDSSKPDPMDRVRWFEKLLAFKKDSVEGLLALANVQIEEGLWGEARKNLTRAEEIRPNKNLYKLWARLEGRATHDDGAVRMLLEKAADAPQERVWICNETGRIYKNWSPISDQGLFNTIIWDFPQGRSHVPANHIGAPASESRVLIGARGV